MSKKILISGNTGFIGSNLTKKLADHELCGIDIINTGSVLKHYGWENIDECNEQQIFIHLAGIAHDTSNVFSEKEYFDINVGLTQKIFQQFLKSSASKFIFFSSVKAVKDSFEGQLLNEEVFPNPETAYGRSKLEAERYILNEFEKWKEDENARGKDYKWKKIYILRPCMIHGPGNKGNLNLLFKFQQRGLPWPLGDFENIRSFCSLGNIMYVIRRLIDDDIESGIYHIADDDPISTNDIIKLMASLLNKKIFILKIPQGIIKLVANAGDLIKIPLNNERLRRLTESYVVSNQKLKNALGIEKMPITAIEGMKQTIESFKKG